jgi:hypothetical protein
MTLKVLLAVVVVAAVAVGGFGWLERVRRTAEAPIEIVLLDSYADPGKGAQGGVNVHYRFVDGPNTLEFVAFRTWSLETIHGAKVCFEPGYPRNQSLVTADDACG